MDNELHLWACNAPVLLYHAARRAALWGEWVYGRRVAVFGDVAVIGGNPFVFVTAEGRYWFDSAPDGAVDEWLATPVRRPGWLLPVVSYMPHHSGVYKTVSQIVAVAAELGGDVFGVLNSPNHIFGARDAEWVIVGRSNGDGTSWWSAVNIYEDGCEPVKEVIMEMLV